MKNLQNFLTEQSDYMSGSVNENANSIIRKIEDFCNTHQLRDQLGGNFLELKYEYGIGENDAVIYAVSWDGKYVYIQVMDSTDAVPSTVFSDDVLMDIYNQIQKEYK